MQPAGVTGSADETAAAILEVGVACAAAVAAVVAGWHFDAADDGGCGSGSARAGTRPDRRAPVVDDPPPLPAGEPLPSVPPAAR